MSGALTDCPKCGFNQPTDQYCANCGIDMLAVRRRAASSLSAMAKKPSVIAGAAIAAIVLTFGVSKMMRRAPLLEDAKSTRLSSQSSPRKENLRAEVSPELRESLDRQIAPANENESLPIDSPVQPEPDSPSIDRAATGAAVVTPSTAPSAPPTAAKPATANSIANDGLLVAFAWTEVSREWLQAMGATELGLHRVPDLEGKLRASAGAYRILEVSKQKITSDMTSFGLRRGDPAADRTALKVEVSSMNENGLTGSIQMNFRAYSGSIRAPAASAMSIEKGSGSILTLPPPPPVAGVAPTGNAIVVLILPRWGGDRNP